MKKKRKVAKRKPVAKRKAKVTKKVVRKTKKVVKKAKKVVKAIRRGRPKGSKNKTQLLTPTLAIVPVLVNEVLVVETPTPVETVVVETPTPVEIPLNADGTKTDTEQ